MTASFPPFADATPPCLCTIFNPPIRIGIEKQDNLIVISVIGTTAGGIQDMLATFAVRIDLLNRAPQNIAVGSLYMANQDDFGVAFPDDEQGLPDSTILGDGGRRHIWGIAP